MLHVCNILIQNLEYIPFIVIIIIIIITVEQLAIFPVI